MFKCVRAIGYVPYWCHYLTFIGRGDGRRYRQEGKANWATNAVRGCVSNLWTRSVKYLDFTETSGQFPVVSVVPKLAFKARKYLFSNPSKNWTFGRTQSKRATQICQLHLVESSHAAPSPEYVQSVWPRLLSALSGVVLSYRWWEPNISRRLLIVKNELEMILVRLWINGAFVSGFLQ